MVLNVRTPFGVRGRKTGMSETGGDDEGVGTEAKPEAAT